MLSKKKKILIRVIAALSIVTIATGIFVGNHIYVNRNMKHIDTDTDISK